MLSYRVQIVVRYFEGYRIFLRNSKIRFESICSVTFFIYDKIVGFGVEEKRRLMRDDTMWQFYEWQQRQFYNKQSIFFRYGILISFKIMVNIFDQIMYFIFILFFYGLIVVYQGYFFQRIYRLEVFLFIQRGDVTIDRRYRVYYFKVKDLLISWEFLLCGCWVLFLVFCFLNVSDKQGGGK